MAEAVEIMSWILRLVDEAEALFGLDEEELMGQPKYPTPAMATSFLKHLLPMGFLDLAQALKRAVALGFGHRSLNLITGKDD